MDTPEPVSLDMLRRPLAELPDPLVLPSVAAARSMSDEVWVRPPGSKSLTNRALLLAGLADGESVVRGALVDADDAQRMLAALRQLGCDVRIEAGDARTGPVVRVRGVGGRWRVGPGGVTLFLNNAGTATRFLAAAALLADGPVTIDGNERMRQRPIGELVEALRGLGARVEELGAQGCPPIRITPPPAERLQAPEVRFGMTQSSQFISAVLLAGAAMPAGVTVLLGPEVTSASYIQMTNALLERVGVTVRASENLGVVRVLPGLRAFDIEIEPDASGATYFWGAAALVPGLTVGTYGLSEASMQGDAMFPSMLGRLGARVESSPRGLCVTGPETLRPVMADMADMPDAAVTLAVVCAFASGTSVLKGVRTLRVKETDRIEALRRELGKLGVVIETDVNGDPSVMTVTPPRGGIPRENTGSRVRFHTYEDHRMAMAMSLVALRRQGVEIEDPRCVAKTYAAFFGDLAAVMGKLSVG